MAFDESELDQIDNRAHSWPMAGREVTELVQQVLLVASLHADGLTASEMAARTGLPERTVKRHLARARHLSSVAHGGGQERSASIVPDHHSDHAQEAAR